VQQVSSPLSFLVGGTAALRWFTLPSAKLVATEVSALQGFGLSVVPGLVHHVSVKELLFSKGVLCLCLCFLIV